MSDRIVGLLTLVVALAFFASATQLEMPFFSDPLGPKLFPMLVSGVAMIAGTMMLLNPDAEPEWPVFSTFIKLFITSIILIIYAYTLKPFGFIFPTAVASAAISFQIKPNLTKSIIIGTCLSVILFLIFKFALGLGLFAFPKALIG
ncbi:tripartite tricarboxylate transporter TctB family protein [Alphaproteobacteria bacterium]|jgi:putative tricarboxylic transport membrane protein|nr:tripartite tricarboxylate transporter TctB family protein [Alphaproteobacteria bacterium]MBT5799623.1 tripartite tricarboxylate transporter TctB family protein [Alphaproteobacteria bacterium]MDA9816298.1 tripartite tricarboxylate transporter TctB family protein [Alphaproteobacteria bacterium]MDC3311774.1 tripartite tricarboxylate transporter TctB family protein [Alphaproteobacteria bacterium]